MKKIAISFFLFICGIAPAFAKNTQYRVFGPDGNYLIVGCKSAVQKIDDPEWSGTGTNLRFRRL